ncbi:MAG: CPBP family intramembrane metalloprotease [Planctomycetota bacterium]|nr:CPBP family intramembrane metalloprotease [Planctomycetota bacterium]
MLFSLITWAAIAAFIILLVRIRRNPVPLDALGMRLRSLPWRIEDAFALLAVFFAIQLINLSASLSAYHFGWLGEAQTEMLQLVLQVITVPLVCLSCLALLMRARGIHFRDWINTENRSIGNLLWLGVFCYLAMFPPFIVAQTLNVTILDFLKVPVEKQSVINMLLNPDYPSWLRIQLIVLAVTAAPIVEEFIFRGIALPALMRRMRTLPAICIVSLIFALIHFHIPSMGPLFVVAFAFSLGYVYSESLLVPIIMHALFNGINLLALLLLKDAPGLTH